MTVLRQSIRWLEEQRENATECLIAASLNNTAFDNPNYVLNHAALSSAGWRECFNSDSAAYGGSNVGNVGATLRADGGTLGVVIPANGFVVLERTG
ncbi:MAG: alpha amylase C-terminal domain-containing protein [Pseudonocardiaceae bacterium]